MFKRIFEIIADGHKKSLINYFELLAFLMLVCIFFIIVYSIQFLNGFAENFEWNKTHTLILLFYITLCITSVIILNKTENKVIQFFLIIILIPIGLIDMMTRLISPFLHFTFNTFFYFLFSMALAFLLLLCLNVMFDFNKNQEIFFLITTGTISSVALNGIIRQILKYLKIGYSTSEKIVNRNLSFEPTSWYEINNIRFVLYLGYLIFLIYYTIILLDESIIIKSNSIENSILYSFLSFLAFDQILLNIMKTSAASKILKTLFQASKSEYRPKGPYEPKDYPKF